MDRYWSQDRNPPEYYEMQSEITMMMSELLDPYTVGRERALLIKGAISSEFEGHILSRHTIALMKERIRQLLNQRGEPDAQT